MPMGFSSGASSGFGPAYHEQLAGTGLLRGKRRMRRENELKVREHVAQEISELTLPDRMQVQIDLVDDQHASSREWIFIVLERVSDAEQQIAAPCRHVLVTVAQI